MRTFALLQALRYLFILGALGVALFIRLPGARLAYVFSVAEILLFFVLFVELGLEFRPPRSRTWVAWIPRHVNFGARSVLSGVLLELNSRLDVLMIGHFLSDRLTGIYSFAALFAEGVFQVLVVLQNNYNPILARQLAADSMEARAAISGLVHKARGRIYLYGLPAALATGLLYPVAVRVLTNKPEFAESWAPFAILLGGIYLASGYVPFNNILVMGGRPVWHTGLMIFTVVCNFALNWALIPVWGIAGSAAATASALSLSVLLLRALTWRGMGLRI